MWNWGGLIFDIDLLWKMRIGGVDGRVCGHGIVSLFVVGVWW